MKILIDTSSLLSMVRYYLPFDTNDVLFNFIKQKIQDNEIILIDRVYEECKYASKGIVLQRLNYLSDKLFLKRSKIPYKTENLLAPNPAKFLRQVDNQFANRSLLRSQNISDAEYESLKNKFMEGADMKLIILALKLVKTHANEDVFIVTEESETENDNKMFKKIPAICRDLGISTITLPELLAKFNVNVKFVSVS